MFGNKLKKNIIETLEDIEVIEYSDEQKCRHRQTLLDHIKINIESPRNQYYILSANKEIPDWAYAYYGDFIRIGSDWNKKAS